MQRVIQGGTRIIKDKGHSENHAEPILSPLPTTTTTTTTEMADLVPDHLELARSAHLEDKQLFFLGCAMEENCLAGSAQTVKVGNYYCCTEGGEVIMDDYNGS